MTDTLPPVPESPKVLQERINRKLMAVCKNKDPVYHAAIVAEVVEQIAPDWQYRTVQPVGDHPPYVILTYPRD